MVEVESVHVLSVLGYGRGRECACAVCAGVWSRKLVCMCCLCWGMVKEESVHVESKCENLYS